MTLNGSAKVTSRRSSSTARTNGTVKFPDFSQDETQDLAVLDQSESSTDLAALPDFTQFRSDDRWPGRRDQGLDGQGRRFHSAGKHGRQKSLSEAIRIVRTRRASVTQNAAEIADALRAPVSIKLVVCCA